MEYKTLRVKKETWGELMAYVGELAMKAKRKITVDEAVMSALDATRMPEHEKGEL